MTAIHDMSAAEILGAYKTKKLSPVEVTDAVIKRIEAWEPRLKALYAPDFEGARKAAKEAEEAKKSKEAEVATARAQLERAQLYGGPYTNTNHGGARARRDRRPACERAHGRGCRSPACSCRSPRPR